MVPTCHLCEKEAPPSREKIPMIAQTAAVSLSLPSLGSRPIAPRANYQSFARQLGRFRTARIRGLPVEG